MGAGALKKMQEDRQDRTYQAHYRNTSTKKEFGGQGSVSESYVGSDPSQVIIIDTRLLREWSN